MKLKQNLEIPIDYNKSQYLVESYVAMKLLS